MNQQPSRFQRIIRRAVMALAVVVLLPVGYVGSWLTVSRAERDRIIRHKTADRVSPVFHPLVAYCKTDLPGSNGLRRLWWLVNPYAAPNESSLLGGPYSGTSHTQGRLAPKRPSKRVAGR